MKTRFLLALLLILLLVATMVSSTPQQEQEIVLKLGTNTSSSHSENLAEQKFSELVSERSGGRIIVEVYDSAKLGDHLERLNGLRNGTIEMTTTSVGYMSNYEKSLEIFESFYTFTSRDHMFRVYDGAGGKLISDTLEPHGFKVLGYFDFGVRKITNNKKPIYNPEDCVGLKIRAPEIKSYIDGLTLMGCSPTPIPFSELYMALQQKVVNGQENSLAIVDSAKFYEVQTYLSHTNHLFYSQIILISKIVWDKLSEADKKLIISAQNDAIDWQRKYSADQENSLLQELRNKGLVDNEVDMQAFKEALTPIRENYINKYGDKATEIYRIIDQAE